jgi:hypothetical protein
MSTKTSFKRIALVAASALAIAGFSAVPSQAASGVDDGNTYAWCSTAAEGSGKNQNIAGNNACTAIAGPANSVVISLDAATRSADALTGDHAAMTAANAVVSVTGSTFSAASTAVLGAGTAPTTATIASGATGTVTVPTTAVGTITVRYFKEVTTGVYSATASNTVTITVIAAAVANIYSSAQTYALETSADVAVAGLTDATTAAFSGVTASAGTSGGTTAVAEFKIVQKDANGDALSANFKAVSAETTLGAVGVAYNAPTGSYAGVAAASANNTNTRFWLFGDGRSGTATVTLKANGVTVGTYTVTFYASTIASLAMVAVNPNIAANSGSFTKAAYNLVLVAKDSSGNAITGGTPGVSFTSSTTGVGTAALGSYNTTAKGWLVVVTAGGTAGSTTITAKDTATGLITATASVTAASSTISSIAMAVDAAEYAPGSLVTVTLTAKDSKGGAVADGKYAGVLAGAVKSSQTIQSGLWLNDTAEDATGLYNEGDVVFTNGVATKTFYAPGVNFRLAGATSTIANLATAVQEQALVAEANIINDATASLALDAANAATDAANNAYDEAQNATQAASDALAAVTALAAQVKSLIASVKKLTAAVAKLKK